MADPWDSLKWRVGAYEARIIRHALLRHGSVGRTAKALQISRRTLAYKLERYRRQGYLNPGSGHGRTGSLPVITATRVAVPLVGLQEPDAAALPCCP